MEKRKMEMDKESIQLCERLESNMIAVLHLLRGNELDSESGMVNQLKSIKFDMLLANQKSEEKVKSIFEKMAEDKKIMETKFELFKLEIEKRYFIDFEARLKAVEKWKTKMIGVGIGVGIGAGVGLKTLWDLLPKH